MPQERSSWSYPALLPQDSRRAKFRKKQKGFKEGGKTESAFVANASDDLDNDDWILDTGESCHLVCDVSMPFKAEDWEK